jgi:choline dehydrogenase-like flavoprotein
MHIDARELGAQEQNCDLCIIGAGPAGISLAREFIGQGLRVALLESGGIEPDARVQALADGPTFGDIKPSAEVNRRQFGGNANVWCIGLGRAEQGLRHALFDEIDFEPRPWLGHAGWPLRRADLMGAYERAQQVCAGGLFDYEPGGWEEDKARQLPLQGQGVETGMFHFSPFEVFTRRYRTQLFEAPNITVYTHATAMELLGRDDRSGVASVRVGGPGQRPWVLHARNVVLAAGGYENARLLLASAEPDGLGNAHDQVGRHYHDHLQGHSGYLTRRCSIGWLCTTCGCGAAPGSWATSSCRRRCRLARVCSTSTACSFRVPPNARIGRSRPSTPCASADCCAARPPTWRRPWA